MNAPAPRSMFSELVEVVMPRGVERPLRQPFTRALIDTEEASSADEIGLDGIALLNEAEGLRVVLRLDKDGRYDLTLTGPNGEVAVPHYALQCLIRNLVHRVAA